MHATGMMETVSPWSRRIGQVMSGAVTLLLVLDGVIKLVPVAEVIEAMRELGYPGSIGLARGLGMLLLACTALYAIPRTSLLGAILLTGYLGGAIATHVRVGNPLLTHTLVSVYLGVFLWGGLYLRDGRLREALFPGAPWAGR